MTNHLHHKCYTLHVVVYWHSLLLKPVFYKFLVKTRFLVNCIVYYARTLLCRHLSFIFRGNRYLLIEFCIFTMIILPRDLVRLTWLTFNIDFNQGYEHPLPPSNYRVRLITYSIHVPTHLRDTFNHSWFYSLWRTKWQNHREGTWSVKAYWYPIANHVSLLT